MPPERTRVAALDWLKALAIIAVVAEHAWPIGGPIVAVIARRSLAFHVPTFLFVAGYLYARATPVSVGEITARLRRILVPYVLASALMLGIGAAPAEGIGDIVWKFVTGSVFGIYYFIPILTLCVLLIYPMSRTPRPVLWLVLACLAAYAARQPAAPIGFWLARDPFARFYFGFFLAGWLLSAWRLPARLPQWRGLVLGAAAIALAVWLAAQPSVPLALAPAAFLRTVETAAVIALVMALTPRRPAPPWIRFLSEATLAIYLYHYPIVVIADHRLGSTPVALRTVLVTLVGLAVSSALVLAARETIGSERTRTLLGG